MQIPRLSVFGAMPMAQCKWRNGKNRTMTLTLSLTLSLTLILINPNPDPNPIPHPKPNPKLLFSPLRHLHCAEYR